ncbi:MAG: hypothetical protein J6W96_05990, partial [Alphaproteobacteria bacterium]|nr:hypothetical protein [Alphaproteobacteria bacterium]
GKFFSDIGSWIADKAKVAYEFFTKPNEDTGKTGFVTWLEESARKIRSMYYTIAGWPIWQKIGKFFSDVGAWIADKAKVAYQFFTEPNEDTGKTGFATWLEETATKITDAYQKIKKWPVWKAIGNFLSNIWGWVLGLFNGGGDGTEAESNEKWYKGTNAISEYIHGFTSTVNETLDAAEGETGQDTQQRVSAIGTFINGILTSVAGIITDVSKNLENVHFDESIKTFLTGAGELINGLFTALGSIFSMLGQMLARGEISERDLDNIDSIMSVVWLIFGKIMEVFLAEEGITTVVGALKGGLGKILGINFTSIGSEIRDIGIGIAAFAAAICAFKLLRVNEDDLKKYGGILLSVMAVVAFMLNAIAGLRSGKTASGLSNATSNAAEKCITAFINALERVAVIFIVMKLLPDIISTIADANVKMKNAGSEKTIGEDIMKTLEGVAILLGAVAGMGLLLALMQKIMPEGLDPGYTAKTVWSVVVALGEIAILIGAIEAMDALLRPVVGEDSNAFYDGIKKLSSAVAQMLTDLGKGIGNFVYAIGHGGLTPEEEVELTGKATRDLVEIITDMSNNMPEEQLELVISMVERMVGIYERIKDLGARAGNAAILVQAQDIAATFKTISESILTILSAFDMNFEFPDVELDEKARKYTGVFTKLLGTLANNDAIPEASETVEAADKILTDQYRGMDLNA